MKLYLRLSALFWFIRQVFIPNPFEECFGKELEIVICNVSIPVSTALINFIVDPIIFGITFWLVGRYYNRGEFPAFGSVLYMAFYCVHILGIYVFCSLYPMIWLIIIILLLYIAIHIAILLFLHHAELR